MSDKKRAFFIGWGAIGLVISAVLPVPASFEALRWAAMIMCGTDLILWGMFA